MTAFAPSSNSELQPLTYRDTTIGYVWHRPESNLSEQLQPDGRVLIVIDDFYDLPVWNYRPTAAHAYGLKELLDYAIQSGDVKAIGFFDLPNPDDPAASQAINQGIRSWITALDLANARYYMLVDYFFSTNIMQDRAFGVHFAENWIRDSNVSMKIAYLSIGGLPSANPYGHDFPIFRKTAIHDQGILPLILLNWLDDEQHRLEFIWGFREIESFFTQHHPVMKHDATAIHEFFSDEQSSRKAQQYQQNVEELIGIALPVEWWNCQQTRKAIHEALKCFCGPYFCGQAAPGNTKRNISIGAACLIAMMAHQEIYKHTTPFTRSDLWREYLQTDSPLFALQPDSLAQVSAKALYDLFSLLFTPRYQSIEHLSRQGSSTVKAVFFENDGKKLRIQLDWNAEDQENLARMMQGIFTQPSILVPQLPGSTRDAIVRLNNQMMISETGFGPFGTVCMDRDTIVIASNK